VPNPKAAKAVIELFASMAGIELDTSDLQKHSETVEKALLELMERMQQNQGGALETSDEDENEEETEALPETEPAKAKEKALDFDTRDRIEKLFERARRDRTRAVTLKQELDKLGVFKQYEDRFLDLFRRAE
jgi:hypothetical protein